MKQLLFGFIICMALIGCSDGRDASGTATDSTASHHSSKQSQISGSGDGRNDTSTMTGRTMMTMMHAMMDSMASVKPSGSVDHDFAQLMRLHHISATEMARMEIARGSDKEMKAMAEKMLADQEKEIGSFNAFLSANPPKGGGNDAFFKQSQTIMSGMHMNMGEGGSIDRQFATLMIPHHQSGIDMAKAYLQAGAANTGLKTVANNIVQTQQQEIAAMKTWLGKNP